MRRNSFSAVLTLAAVAMTALALATPAGAGLWTPAEIATELWYDAADAGTVTHSGGAVSQWDDKSGNGRNATGIAGPGYVLAEQNGLNVMRLNGSSQYFDLGTGLDWMAADADHTAFVVLKNDNDVNIYGAANGGAGDASLHVGFNGGSYRLNRWGNDWGTAKTANYNAGAYNFLRFGWDEGGQKFVYANAKKEGDSGGHVASGLSAMAGGGRIGNVVGQGLLDADIGEFVILNTAAPTQDTVDRVEGYLAWKWGLEGNLPSGHPYESEAPQVNLIVNGEFAMYKPGTNYTVRGTAPGDIWVQQIGDNRPLSSGTPVSFDDGSTGMVVDIPGWITPRDSQGSPTGTADLFTLGYEPTDGTSCLNAFGAWSGQNGNLAESAAPLDLPDHRAAIKKLELSAMVIGDVAPRTFDLLVDGVVLTPDSLVDPPYDAGVWQEISRTYTNIPAGDVTVLVGTSRPGPGDPALVGTRLRFDNISLTVTVPEPSTLALAAFGLLGLGCFGRRRRRWA